jgi:ribosomal protein S18 acetylase RimI-like enzyme
MPVQIIYAKEELIPSFHKTLDEVARERIYIEMVEAFPLEKVAAFQKSLIEKNAPVYYAVDNNRVVGWIDVGTGENPRLKHRASMGMGVQKNYRGQGLGSKLMKAALDHAKQIGLEKVELQVYTTNVGAIALYKKFGFEEEGVIRKYRKMDGKYFDAMMMGVFL